MVFAIVDEQTRQQLGRKMSSGGPKLISDKTLDRNKTFTLAGIPKHTTRLDVVSLRVELTTAIGGIIGVRSIEIEWKDSEGDVILGYEFIETFATIDATKAWQASTNLVERVGTNVAMELLPMGISMTSGQSLEIREAADIDPFGDTMTVHIIAMAF